MKMMTSPRCVAALAALGWSLLECASATVVSYDFNISWVRANPDGAFERPTIGINGQWPIPRIDVNVGDTLRINAYNGLGNQSTSLHFHGLMMENATHMDGPSQVSQCAILPGSSFVYEFKIEQSGTYWYHSHTESQYPDGLRGPLIVHDPDSPYSGEYDEEVVVTLSDWYHDQMPVLIKQFMNKGNPTGAEPVPQAALINDTQHLPVSVQPGKTYLFRLINIGAFASQYFWIEGHNFTVVEVDGVYTKPHQANMLYLAAAQRYSFLLTTRDNADANFPIVSSMDTGLFDLLPDDLDWNVTGWLVYDEKATLPKPAIVAEFDELDDMELVPHDEMALLPEPDHVVTLNAVMDVLGDGENYAFFNDITYKAPKVPTLYTALTSGEMATNAQIYGTYTNTFVLQKDEIVQIVLNNLDDGRHPFHLHGHQFQAIRRSEEDAGLFDEESDEDFPEVPMRRDTLIVEGNGHMVLRFKADNPGVWLFHCHIEWHVTSGLIATFVEAPLELQKTIDLPKDHLSACAAANIPTVGNAAGNNESLLDLSGQNSPPPRLPDGFTLKGIVAFVISCIMGITGVSVVAWYGMANVENEEDKTREREPLLAGPDSNGGSGDANDQADSRQESDGVGEDARLRHR